MPSTWFLNSFTYSLVLIFSLNAISGCNGKTNENPNNDENKIVAPSIPNSNATTSTETPTTPKETEPFSWSKLSGWHTQGIISRKTPIRIIFNRNIIDDDLVGKDASKIMHITPSIDGNPKFENKKEIVWTPSKQLQAGTEYKVSITPKGLKDVPANVAPLKFSFHVIPLEFEIKNFGLTTAPNKASEMLLKGQLLVSDRVNPNNVESVIKATLQDKKLPIEWLHSDNGKKYNFIIGNIKRETFPTDIRLIWDGKPINIDTQGSQEISVPSINEFKMINTRVIHSAGTNPYVQIRFSDNLDSAQNIKGLVQLTKNKYKVRIDGNTINIYPNKNLSGHFKVRINEGLKAKNGKILTTKIEKDVVFDNIKPQVKFVGKGSILPENTTLEIPFEAVSAKSIQVTAFEIYPDNMGQFLQVNKLSGSYETGRTGRYLWRKTIPLTPADPNQWNRYSFNVTELMKNHRGGLLRLTLNINPHNSAYDCSANGTDFTNYEEKPLKNLEDNGVEEASGWDGISNYAEGENNYDYNWDKRNDPCSTSYFIYNKDKTTVSQNFIPSNIGLIAKKDGKGNLHIISTDLRTAEPLTGVEFEVTNYQKQILGKATSDGSGFANIELSGTPFLLIAKKFKDTSYLKLNNKTALAISHFPVGGKKITKGIKGKIYGERGVWRPGDDIYLTFVVQNTLQDKTNEKKLPLAHPVTMQLINPSGTVVSTKTSTDSVGGFYTFKFSTKESSETGNWMAKAFIGGASFSKSLMIETVRPNRLKIELTFDDAKLNASKEPVLYSYDGVPEATLFSQWLHGATASNLKAEVSVQFSSKKTRFDKFTDYNFDDPARRFKSEEKVVLKGRLDDKGYLKFRKDIEPKGYPAGMLRARFTTRVFEEGGAFSISRSSIDYHPYENYVGIKLPKGDATRGMLLTDIKHTVKIASLNARGESVSLDEVKVSLYKIDWKWWWDKSASSLAEYADGQHKNLLQSGIVKTADGNGSWDFEIKYPEWGRYLIRACDLEGKHCTGKTVYIDWPGWAGRAQEEGSGAASRLNLFSDKKAYTVGETAIIQLPANNQGRALMTVETGSAILEQRWITFEAGGKDRKQFKLPITAAMSPNAYVHITLLQPHKDKNNDRPIRLYGIIPLEVSDPATYLKPKIMADDEWKPDSKQTIVVSEETGKTMNYTLAIVDEGLLGLTAFKTPNLHKYFYSKEALGIKTWDLFDEVIGAYGGKLERMLALGGGDEAEIDNEDSKKRRFPPVVQFLGPFTLDAGKTAEHEITIPTYLGAVRVMLVAGDKGAYGKAQKSVFVRQALMMQASLPRVLGPDEEVSVPVTLFALDDGIKNVNIKIETDDLVNVLGDKEKNISFSKTGEKLAFIKLKTASREGKTHLRFIATSGTNNEHVSTSDIYLEIRRANKETTRSISKVIEANESWSGQADAFGITGTNKATLELSSVPSLNLDSRSNYLIRYPHGCLEQTTSSAFPQLYLNNVMNLDKQKQQKAEHHIQKAIERLQRFQQGSGDFSYWPGNNQHNDWASIYAGHFLVEAQKKGYLIPNELLNNWLSAQVDKAQQYVASSEKYSHTQAYRLYVLALANKPQMGAMNRLRESSKLNKKARWLLASAYQSASQPDAAKAVIQGMLPTVETVNSVDKTFSSTLGDLGLQLESLIALGKKKDANQLVEKIADEMNGDAFQSTQGIAWALMSVSRYLEGDTSHFSAKIAQDGSNNTLDIKSDKPIYSISIANEGAKFNLENTSNIKLFANLVNHGVPKAGSEQSIQTGLKLSVKYATRDEKDANKWQPISADIAIQGKDIVILAKITNTSGHDLENIALTIPVAAGMEILSTDDQGPSPYRADYRDIRDDRIHYYFSLKKGQSKKYLVLATAAYKGRYYLPAVNVEAMYEGNIRARLKGKWINIIETEDEGKDKAQGDSPADAAKGTLADAVSNAVENNNDIRGIRIAKAYLYDDADETTRTKMYLVSGDKVKVLKHKKADDNSRWLFIKYKGAVELKKWIRAEVTE